MRVPRTYVPDLPPAPGEVHLDGEDAAHLIRVLRLKSGDLVEGFDGDGGAAHLRLVQVERRRVTLRVEERLADKDELPFELTCAVACPKGKRAHRMVESLTELGVTRFIPLELKRSAAPAPTPDTVTRWAIEASKQCGRNTLLRALPAHDLEALRAVAQDYDLRLLPDTLNAGSLRDLTSRARPARVLVAIGPEGGFADAERDALKADGFCAFRLGATTLRIETAATAVVAALVAAWA